VKEDHVTTNEFYYLILVLGAFACFAAGVLTATLRYKAWLRRQESLAATQPVRAKPAKPAFARAA
jgi:hypothetical protein